MRNRYIGVTSDLCSTWFTHPKDTNQLYGIKKRKAEATKDVLEMFVTSQNKKQLIQNTFVTLEIQK